MKLILSRKGFDSSDGGVPSPIFPDDHMISLPIPDRTSGIPYADIHLHDGTSMGDLVATLTRSKVPANYQAHLDPDLWAGSFPRQTGWRPVLGQTDAAEGHLRKQEVGSGDVFLFFGLFRHVEQRDGIWRYKKECRPQHVFFGWLQIDCRMPVEEIAESAMPWARYHPHFHGKYGSSNTLYLSKERLSLPGVSESLPGAGIFPMYSQSLCLTAKNAHCPSKWRLPGWFDPARRPPRLSYNCNPGRWTTQDGAVFLNSAGRGQEFVLDSGDYPEAVEWMAGLMRQGSGNVPERGTA